MANYATDDLTGFTATPDETREPLVIDTRGLTRWERFLKVVRLGRLWRRLFPWAKGRRVHDQDEVDELVEEYGKPTFQDAYDALPLWINYPVKINVVLDKDGSPPIIDRTAKPEDLEAVSQHMEPYLRKYLESPLNQTNYPYSMEAVYGENGDTKPR